MYSFIFKKNDNTVIWKYLQHFVHWEVLKLQDMNFTYIDDEKYIFLRRSGY